MLIQENVSLRAYSTMRLGGIARYLSEIKSRDEIAELVDWATDKNLPIIVIGDGSNIVWRDEGFSGLVIVNRITGITTASTETDIVNVTASAGENWDDFVAKTLDMGLSGIELLSLIPGTVGASPVQNIGAYGCQLSDVLTTIEAFDLTTKQFVTLNGSECGFGYRTSMFKTTERNRYLITNITVQLSKTPVSKNLYHSLESYLTENNIQGRTPKLLRDAVINIRNSKLPDPKIVANCGSFFANPIISHEKLNTIIDSYPEFAKWHTKFIWEQPNGQVKIAAGALLEQAGFKDFHDPETGMGTWPKQALVMVNEHAKNTADLLKFKQNIVDTIQQKFDITLEQEPELLP